MEDRIRELETFLHQRDRQIAAVHKISDALFSKLKLEDLVKETLEVSLETVGAGAGTVFMHNPENDTLVFTYVVGEKAQQLTGLAIKSTQGVAGEVFQSGKAKISEDMTKEKSHLKDVGEKIDYVTQNMVTVPLKSINGDPIGVMQVLNKHEGNFDEMDLELLTILSAQAATAIENARLFEEAKLAIVVKLMGDISHDIKNLITPVMTCAQTLEMMMQGYYDDMDKIYADYRDKDPELVAKVEDTNAFMKDFYPEAIQMFMDGSVSTQERVREIADCVKGIVSQPTFEFISPSEVIDKVIKPLKMVGDKSNVAVQIAGESAPATMIDQKQLYNAVYNLVNNAIPETPAGGSITVSCNAKADGDFPEGKYVMISVADTGKGMPEHVRAKLFTKDAVSTKPGGTGLGTRIVKNVIDAHHGTITVESEQGKGTTFRVKIPYLSSQEELDAFIEKLSAK